MVSFCSLYSQLILPQLGFHLGSFYSFKFRKSAPRYSGYKSSSTRKWTAWELSFRKSLVGYRKLFFKLTKKTFGSWTVKIIS